MRNQYETQVHEFPPEYHADSRILIMGSFPSVKSRATGFYYGHPQNRFWKLLAGLYKTGIPETIAEKKAFLQQYRIALWDVIARCEIIGSSDSSIRNVTANDIGALLAGTEVVQLYANGRTAQKLYEKYVEPSTGRKAVCLPSTSPANAAWTMDRLAESWSRITQAG